MVTERNKRLFDGVEPLFEWFKDKWEVLENSILSGGGFFFPCLLDIIDFVDSLYLGYN